MERKTSRPFFDCSIIAPVEDSGLSFDFLQFNDSSELFTQAPAQTASTKASVHRMNCTGCGKLMPVQLCEAASLGFFDSLRCVIGALGCCKDSSPVTEAQARCMRCGRLLGVVKTGED